MPPHASAEAIQQAYRERAKELHPDRNPERREWATEQFQQLNEAYRIVSDPTLRRQYDERRTALFGNTRRNKAKRRRNRYTASGVNWWDVPNQAQPGYSGVYGRGQRRSAAADYRPGGWLKKIGLGVLRPLYIALYDLATSPYRWLLALLTLILFAYVVLFASSLLPEDASSSQNTSPLPTLIEPNVAVGQVATNAPPTPIRLPESITLLECDVMLAVAEIQLLAQSDLPKVSARVHTPNLRVRAGSVRLMQIELIGEAQARPLDAGRPAELVVTVDEDAQQGEITAPDLAAGTYVLSWTPLAPDGRILGMCQQVFSITD